MSGRLARGRNYARRGQVLGFEISCGYVTAQVQGSRPKPYRVRIQVTPLTTPQWRRVEQALAGQALFRAKLLAGEMPQEIEEVFADCGTPLFPRSARDLEMSCSCPDWGVPCKHLAAVCYVLAEAFDVDPFGILAWRGRGREELLGALRLTAAQDEARPAADRRHRPPAGRVHRGLLVTGHELARLRALPPVPAAPPDLLLRTFEPPPVLVRSQDLADPAGPGLPSARRRRRSDPDLAQPGPEPRPGRRATPPYHQWEPSLSASSGSSAPHSADVRDLRLGALVRRHDLQAREEPLDLGPRPRVQSAPRRAYTSVARLHQAGRQPVVGGVGQRQVAARGQGLHVPGHQVPRVRVVRHEMQHRGHQQPAGSSKSISAAAPGRSAPRPTSRRSAVMTAVVPSGASSSPA